MSKSVRVGVIQGNALPGHIEKNLETLSRLTEQAAAEGAEVVVTPELFATGYDPAVAWQWDGSYIRQCLANIAHELHVGLVASTVDTPRNSEIGAQNSIGRYPAHIAASFFTPTGTELKRVHKQHLYGPEEQKFMTPGESYAPSFEWNGIRWGMGICYDVEFPEFARSLAQSGAEVLLVPTAVPELEYAMDGRDSAWAYSATMTSTLQVPVRALENGVFVAYSNHCGPGFTGNSCIATPFGHNAVLLGVEESVAVIEADLLAIQAARQLNTYLRDVGGTRE